MLHSRFKKQLLRQSFFHRVSRLLLVSGSSYFSVLAVNLSVFLTESCGFFALDKHGFLRGNLKRPELSLRMIKRSLSKDFLNYGKFWKQKQIIETIYLLYLSLFKLLRQKREIRIVSH